MIGWGREGMGLGRVLMRLHMLRMAHLFLFTDCVCSVLRVKFVNSISNS